MTTIARTPGPSRGDSCKRACRPIEALQGGSLLRLLDVDSRHSIAPDELPLWVEAVWKLGEILQTIEQSKIFRDFFDSERLKASQKRTKQARVKTRGSFYTASTQSGSSCCARDRLVSIPKRTI